MKYKTILITGGAGFIGSNIAVKLKQRFVNLEVIVIDNLKRRGSEMNLLRLKSSGIDFLHADIRCREDLKLAKKIDLIIECSAEPSVMAGFSDNPEYLINTNLVGTINCLELARINKTDVIFLSTSRVYPFQEINNIKTKEQEKRLVWIDNQKIEGFSKDGLSEDFALSGPKTLYGATKLASELILEEYGNIYGIKYVINRCGVIAGPWQFGKVDQGIFTFWMLAHYFKKNLQYIGFGGKGKQVRDLLHVDDLFELILKQLGSLDKKHGLIYNVGGGKINLSLAELTEYCKRITGNKIEVKQNKSNRPGDIKIYITDNSKVSSDFSWKPKKSQEDILVDIYNWISDNEEKLKNI